MFLAEYWYTVERIYYTIRFIYFYFCTNTFDRLLRLDRVSGVIVKKRKKL